SGRELGEDRPDMLRVDRLHQVRVEAGGFRALAIERLAVAADRHQPDLGAVRHRPQPPGDLEAIDSRQAEVDQGDREFAGLRVVEPVLAAARGHHFVTVELQQQAQALARVVVVLHDEDPRRTERGRRGQIRRRDGRGASGQANDELATEPFSRAGRFDGAAVLPGAANAGSARRVASPSATGCRSTTIRPVVTRATSSRSSTRRARWWVWRPMIIRIRAVSSSWAPSFSSTVTALLIAARGFRSSWASIARNSSLRRSRSSISR